MSFADRLEEAIARAGSPGLMGLDAHLDLLPPEFEAARDPDTGPAERAALVRDFLIEALELAAGRLPAVKPQSAFFELLGAPGAEAWEAVVRAAHEAGLLVIGDVKRGDIGSTARAYAAAYLEGLPGAEPATLCDAVTVNPYLGEESIQPFLEVCGRTGRGIYVLVRTSNPGAAQFQRGGVPHLCLQVADEVDRWGKGLVGECGLAGVGAVVGATCGEELAELRARMPAAPLLLPGYGAQGAGAQDVAAGFLAPPGVGPCGALVNSSRGLLFAWRKAEGRHWKDATLDAIEHMRGELAAVWRGAAGAATEGP